MMTNSRKHITARMQATSPPFSHRSLPLAICLVLLSTSSHAWEKKVTTHGKSIIAYFASWQTYDRSGLAKPSNLKSSKVTRYNFAFFQTNVNGDIWGTDEFADPISLYGEIRWDWVAGQGGTYCSWVAAGKPPECKGHKYYGGLIYLAHSAGVEVYPSIGGWTLSNSFPAMAKNPTARLKFASNCAKLIETYDFDGIDIDWEYPGYADHMGTPEDAKSYSLLLQDIRIALDELGKKKGKVYGLTAALPCGPDHMKNIEIDVVSKVLSELNLMTYDLYGVWDKKTGPNAPLYDVDGGNPGLSVHSCVENWKAGGGSPDQINIGLPFYGRSFAGRGLTAFGQANDGTADVISWPDDEGSPQYYNIKSKLSSYTSVRDEQTKTQYAYNEWGFISYDDERAICDKTEYGIDNNLNGYIIWEISGDLMPDLSTPLLDALGNRLNNTDVRCESVDWLGPKPIAPTAPTQRATPLPTASLTNQPTETLSPTMEGILETASPTKLTGGKAETSPPQTEPAQPTKPTPIPTERVDPIPANVGTTLFYPDFTSDGTPAGCRNDGNAPEWITSDMMKSTKGDCCSSYFDPYFSNSLADRCNQGYPYYPNFETHSCVNDGNHPSWMAGDYLADTQWKCCSNVFRDKKLLDKCTGTSQ